MDEPDVGGRPTKYSPEYDEKAAKLCHLGATDRDLADFFEVAESTLNLWKLKHQSFSESLKLGKEAADARVEQSLYRRATGYTFDSEKIFNDKDDGIVRAACLEHVAPDVTACIFWLKNRKPAEWRDRIEQAIMGKDGGPIVISSTDAEL